MLPAWHDRRIGIMYPALSHPVVASESLSLASSAVSQALKYLKIDTCPASQKLLKYMGKKFTEALVNASGRVLFSSPVSNISFLLVTFDVMPCLHSKYRKLKHCKILLSLILMIKGKNLTELWPFLTSV